MVARAAARAPLQGALALRLLSTCLCLALLGIYPAVASETDDVVAVVRKTVDDFNKGDDAAFAKDLTEAPHVIDEFPPFFWSGADALQSWDKAYRAEMERNSFVKTVMSLQKPRHVDVRDGHAYVVVSAICDFTQKTKKHVRESGILTMALTKSEGTSDQPKSGAAWRVSALTWTKQ